MYISNLHIRNALINGMLFEKAFFQPLMAIIATTYDILRKLCYWDNKSKE